MRTVKASLMDIDEFRISETGNFIVGRIVRITEDGRAVVDYPGNPMGPIEARSVAQAPPEGNGIGDVEVPVLLVFENGDKTLPIIVGIIRNTLHQSDLSKRITLSINKPKDVLLDGKKMVFEAKEEIELRCGKSTVTLRKDGKIIIKGAEIISRASGINQLKFNRGVFHAGNRWSKQFISSS